MSTKISSCYVIVSWLGLEMAHIKRNGFQQVLLAICHLILIMVCSFHRHLWTYLPSIRSFNKCYLNAHSAQNTAHRVPASEQIDLKHLVWECAMRRAARPREALGRLFRAASHACPQAAWKRAGPVLWGPQPSKGTDRKQGVLRENVGRQQVLCGTEGCSRGRLCLSCEC